MRLTNTLRRAAAFAAAVLITSAPAVTRAAEGEDDPLPKDAGRPAHYVAPASDEAEQAIKQFALPPGWKAELFAAEPRVANPVCLSIDDRGRVYVVETFRRRNAVLDIRKIGSWLDEDLANRTVEDRIAMVKRRMPNDWQKLEGITDRVRLLEDSDGDGKADKDTVFAAGFDTLAEGTAAGVLPVGGSVYFTNIPHLWKLTDADGDGVAERRQSLAYGFGVRYNYSGHDFHGLRMGPDGRVYFSIADRGLHVEKDGKVIVSAPDEGAVLRCEPDGSNLEIVHRGLRNPQELAFDEFGNLFTADNNSDAGDATRWVHVVDGGDSGWHVGWQWLGGPIPRGPWNAEKLWEVEPTVPAFYRLPPIANPKIAGPAGLTYTPGGATIMPKDWQNRFLLVDFRGGPAGGSGIYALKNKPKGASFELEETKELVTNVLPTDVEFGPDGGIYFTDWVTGWEPHGKGRVYKVTPPGLADDTAAAAVKKLLAEGFAKRPDAELAGLLAHADQRVRQHAQFELAGRGDLGVAALAVASAGGNPSQLARVHAVWGLGQVARRSLTDRFGRLAVPPLLSLLTDPDAEVKAQAAKMLGDARAASAAEPLTRLLRDRSARVQFFAANAVGQLRASAAADAVLAMLRKNNDRDAYLRHAGVMALVGMNDAKVLEAAANDASAALRMAALLAWRKQSSPQVARFLEDADPTLVLEAARAVNDLTIIEAMPKLAALTAKAGLSEHVLNRALNAHYRLGTAENANALAAFAARSDVQPAQREEAIRMLADWAKPSGRDRVTGLWRPVPPRDVAPAKDALAGVLDPLLKSAPDAVRIAALKAATTMGVARTPLIELVRDERNPPGLRAAAVAAMGETNDKQLADGAKVAMTATDPIVRIAAIRVQPAVPGGVKALAGVLAAGTPREQQAAVQTAAAAVAAGKDPDKAAENLLKVAFGRLEENALPPEAHLDLLEAAAEKKGGKLSDAYKAYEAARRQKVATDPLALHREALAGGDADRGGYVFRERADVSCLRCHAINKVGGNAGPDLAGLAARYGATGGGGTTGGSPAHGVGANGGGVANGGREYLLESILYPSKKVAQGWETVALRTNDGDVIAGVFKGETDAEVTLEVPNQGPVKVAKANIKSRQGGLSGMPDDIANTLSKQDLRDLVEYLAGQ